MKERKPRMGRPPRTDNPVDVGTRLPGTLWRWVRAQAKAEGRGISEVLVSALVLYQRSIARRRTKGGRT